MSKVLLIIGLIFIGICLIIFAIGLDEDIKYYYGGRR